MLHNSRYHIFQSKSAPWTSARVNPRSSVAGLAACGAVAGLLADPRRPWLSSACECWTLSSICGGEVSLSFMVDAVDGPSLSRMIRSSAHNLSSGRKNQAVLALWGSHKKPARARTIVVPPSTKNKTCHDLQCPCSGSVEALCGNLEKTPYASRPPKAPATAYCP